MYAEISGLSQTYSSNSAISISDGTTTNRVFLNYSTSTNIIKFQGISGGATAFFIQSTLTNITVTQKVAIKWDGTAFDVFINGVSVGTDDRGLSFSTNTLTSVGFNRGSSAEFFYGNTKDIRVYNEALTDAQLQTLTTL